MLPRAFTCLVLALVVVGCAENASTTQEVQFLKFYADWCAPCKVLQPIVGRLEQEFPGVVFKHINVDHERELAKKYKVDGIPCIVIVVDGKEKKRFLGVKSRETLAAELSKYRPG